MCACNSDPVCSGTGPSCSSGTQLATCSSDSQGCYYQAASTSCSAPINGSATCNNGACGESCAMQSAPDLCNHTCLNLSSDASHCGGCTLKCPTGSLCKSGSCEVRIGFPNRFTGNEASPFGQAGDFISAFPITVSTMSTLVAFGFINSSTTANAIASFGLYTSVGNLPGTLIASALDVALTAGAQEPAASAIVLTPGTYYFAVQNKGDTAEPLIYTDPASQIDWFVGGLSRSSGLPSSFSSVAPEMFSTPTPNVYIVVKQQGS
jgi:hypothetical protein